jgi:hypothetical protein
MSKHKDKDRERNKDDRRSRDRERDRSHDRDHRKRYVFHSNFFQRHIFAIFENNNSQSFQDPEIVAVRKIAAKNQRNVRDGADRKKEIGVKGLIKI